jgi:hypothetical protein
MPARIAIAPLTFRTDRDQVAFYELFAKAGYEVFVFVDDPDFGTPASSTATYVKVSEQKCIEAGYVVLNPLVSMKRKVRVSEWEKALYFFGTHEGEFDHVWFLEDDVFVPRTEIIQRIDRGLPDADLLCEGHRINHFGELKSWVWWMWVPKDVLPLPWAWSMVCAVRMSKSLLAEMHRTIVGSTEEMKRHFLLLKKAVAAPKFLWIEFLFNAIALHQRLKVVTPTEPSIVLFHKAWTLDELDDQHIYHPANDKALQQAWRSRLSE